jgi:hypothetical protein
VRQGNVRGHVNAHDHHSAPAHTGSHTATVAPGGVGKQPKVEAQAAKALTKEDYKSQARQFMKDVFFIKNSAIGASQGPLGTSPVKPSPNFLGEALKFAIGIAGGPFMDAVGMVGVARAAVGAGIPLFANLVGNSFKNKQKTVKTIALEDFITDYQFAVHEHGDRVTKELTDSITSAHDGKTTVDSLNGVMNGGKLSVSSAQQPKIGAQTRLETLDAWTVALQKQADLQDKGKQGYSDSSTGQLHLHSLAIYANGKLEVATPALARMDGIGNKAAQYNAGRPLQSIPVQRTINVLVKDSQDDHFGLSIAADGKITGKDGKVTKDEFQGKGPESDVLKSFYKSRTRSKSVTHEEALAEVWNVIKTQSPSRLGFTMKGD